MLSNSRFAPRHEPLRKRFAILALVVILLVSGAVSAKADYVDIVPSLGVKQEYNDNLFYSADKIGDFITTFAPGVELQEKTERIDARVFTSIRGLKYARNNQYDTVDYTFLGSAHYQLSPRMNVTASAEFDRDSGPSRDLGPAATVSNTVRRYQQRYALLNEYRITEKTSGSIGYTYSQYEYVTVPVQTITQSVTQPGTGPPPPPPTTSPPPPPPPPTLPPPTKSVQILSLSDSDVTIHAPTVGLVHTIDEKTKGTIDAGYTHFLYKYSTVDNVELTASLSRALNESWNVSARGGVRYTTTDFILVQRTYQPFPVVLSDQNLIVTARSSGWVGQCVLGYSDEYGGGRLSFYRDVTQGRSSANETTGVMMDARHKFTYELEGNFSAGYQLNHASREEFGGDSVSDRVLQFRAGLRYDVTKDIYIDSSYAMNIADIAGSHFTQNSAFVNLVMKFPLFRR